MNSIIVHDGKTYSVDQIKKDFDVVNEFMTSSYTATDQDGMSRKARLASKYSAMKYVFSNFAICRDYDEKTRLIFKAQDICKKYYKVDLSKKPAQPPKGDPGVDYKRAMHLFQTKIMLDIEDFVIAYDNPEWSEIYLQCVPGCNKAAHKKIIESHEYVAQ